MPCVFASVMRKSALPFPKIGSVVLLAVILAVVFFSYLPALENGFVFWDDDVHLYENITVRSLDAEHVGDIFKSTVNKIYIPLTTLSFAAEYHYFGYDPFIYHLDNLLLHLGVTALVFWLGLRLGLPAWGSGAAALLFGVHPVRVESVAWVTERKDVLYAFFYMAALLSYSRYLDFTKPDPSVQNKKSSRFLVLTTALGVLSMLAKPMALSLPLVLLLFDRFHGRRIGRGAILEKIPLILAVAGLAWVSYAAHARIPGKGVVEGFLIWSWTFVFYLRQFLFPFILVPVYRLPRPVGIFVPDYFLSVAVLCLLVFAVIRFRKHRWFIFSAAFYVLSIFFLLRYDEAKDTNIVADRFMYLPTLGFCFLLGYGFQRLLERGERTRLPARQVYAFPAVMGLVIVTGVFAAATYRQCRVWRGSISLWRHQLKIFPDEPVALNNLAAALREEEGYKKAEEVYRKSMEIRSEGLSLDSSGELMEHIRKVDDVIGLYAKAIEARPDFIDSYYHLGNLLGDIGRIPEAVEAYKKTLSLDYTYKDAHFSLGSLYQKAGDSSQAIFAFDQTIGLYPRDEDVYVSVISAYNEALKENPGNAAYRRAREKAMDRFMRLVNGRPARATSFFNLGYLYGEMGDFTRAVSAYQMALDINPNHGKALYNLGNLYRDKGRLAEALAMYQRTVKADPGKSDAFLSMGAIYDRRGNRELAKENFQKAIKADPRNARAWFNLGYVEEQAGILQKALDFYQKSIKLDPGNTEAHYNLGNVYARKGKNQEAISSYLRAVEADPNYMDAWVNLSILSFKEGDFANAVKYCDEAVLLGYNAPQGYLNALAPYR